MGRQDSMPFSRFTIEGVIGVILLGALNFSCSLIPSLIITRVN